MEQLADKMMERINVLTAQNNDLRKEISKLKMRIKNGYDSNDENIFCDYCSTLATRKYDGDDLCDKCYLREKYKE
jgi:hypothetical protein